MIVSHRYAEGFLEYAKETIGIDRALAELQLVKDAFRDNPDFMSFLENPAITVSEKCEVSRKVFGGRFSEETRSFLELLLRKGRIGLIAAIAGYARIRYAHGEEADALLETSYPLSTEYIGAIKDSLEKKLRRQLHLYVKLEPDLLGGVRVTIGNLIIDGSVRRRLTDLREKVVAARIA